MIWQRDWRTCGFVVCDFLSKVTILWSVLIRVVAEVEIHLSHELILPHDERVKWQCRWWPSRSGLVVIRFVQVEIWFVFAFNLSTIFKASSRSAWLSDYKVWKSSFVGFFWHISSDKVRQSNFITKCDRLLLESSPDITKCDKLFPAGNYIFKVNKRNTRTRCEICSKLKVKLYVLVSLLLNLNIFPPAGLLQSTSDVTKCDRRYYKVHQMLRSVTVTTKWDVTQMQDQKSKLKRKYLGMLIFQLS